MSVADTSQFPFHRQPELRVMPGPADTNHQGDIFGGWIMSQMDLAGSVAAYRRAGGRVVTVAVDSLQFHQPVFVGDLVSCYAEILKVGRSSIRVRIQVFVERDREDVQYIKVTEGEIVYVAIDSERRPRDVGG